jgi:vancomycin resistance protein YoaR
VKFDQVPGYFETHYNAAGKRARERSYNLRSAPGFGAVVMPGQIFDFQRHRGPRDEANRLPRAWRR